jgi:hypothetical protein
MKVGHVFQSWNSVEESMATSLQQPQIVIGNNPSESKSFVGSPVSAREREDARRQSARLHSERERQKQALHLQKLNILSQNISNPSRRAAMAMALAQIEENLRAIN